MSPPMCPPIETFEIANPRARLITMRVVALPPSRPVEPELRVERPARAVEPRALDSSDQVDADVDRDQRLRHERLGPGARGAGGDARRRDPAARAGVVGTTEAYGGRRHALRADRPS